MGGAVSPLTIPTTVFITGHTNPVSAKALFGLA